MDTTEGFAGSFPREYRDTISALPPYKNGMALLEKDRQPGVAPVPPAGTFGLHNRWGTVSASSGKSPSGPSSVRVFPPRYTPHWCSKQCTGKSTQQQLYVEFPCFNWMSAVGTFYLV